MSENFPNEFEGGASEQEQKTREVVALAKELSESREVFPFPEIESGAYSKLKATDEEYPGYTTPIDELVVRFAQEGIKVVLGSHPDSGNVFILPAGSDDIERDSVFPRHLQFSDDMDPRLKKLILLNKS